MKEVSREGRGEVGERVRGREQRRINRRAKVQEEGRQHAKKGHTSQTAEQVPRTNHKCQDVWQPRLTQAALDNHGKIDYAVQKYPPCSIFQFDYQLNLMRQSP